MDLIPGTARPVLVPKNGWPGLNMRAPTLSRLHLNLDWIPVCVPPLQNLPRLDWRVNQLKKVNKSETLWLTSSRWTHLRWEQEWGVKSLKQFNFFQVDLIPGTAGESIGELDFPIESNRLTRRQQSTLSRLHFPHSPLEKVYRGMGPTTRGKSKCFRLVDFFQLIDSPIQSPLEKVWQVTFYWLDEWLAWTEV